MKEHFTILFEVPGTSVMKLSDSFTKPLYSVAIFVCYIGVHNFLVLILKSFTLSVVYVVWSGVGLALISNVGWRYFAEKADVINTISLNLVFLGLIGLNISIKH